MGDLMHALPALTEAKAHFKEIEFDWVVDKSFSEVPKWHPAVNKIITTDHRNWKKQLLSPNSRKAFQSVIQEINNTNYDLVIDMQNNLKSALVSFMCKHQVIGMDSKSVREYPAHLSYNKKISISKELHAITRQKILLSNALGYLTSNSKDYGISDIEFKEPSFNLPNEYVALVQNASWKTKQWSIANWQLLVKHFDGSGIEMIFPSGNEEELKRAEQISSISDNAHALKPLSLNETAYIMKKAKFSVCSDTGLAHLSAVVGTPSLTLYGPTDTKLIGTEGINQLHVVGTNNNINSISIEDVISKLPSI
ncbi:MAG: lipopolysaccharide heptosyltransferase I [SAR86 cluster bacterium]|nr:lipopolysaccharide heptosyltransferase I [SAR86 cluster bacterium]